MCNTVKGCTSASGARQQMLSAPYRDSSLCCMQPLTAVTYTIGPHQADWQLAHGRTHARTEGLDLLAKLRQACLSPPLHCPPPLYCHRHCTAAAAMPPLMFGQVSAASCRCSTRHCACLPWQQRMPPHQGQFSCVVSHHTGMMTPHSPSLARGGLAAGRHCQYLQPGHSSGSITSRHDVGAHGMHDDVVSQAHQQPHIGSLARSSAPS
jgi:hypothetical protein